MAWLRNRGDEDAARAAAGPQPIEPVLLGLGRRNQIEVEIVCQRLRGDGHHLAWYFQSPVTGRALTSGLGNADAFVLVDPQDAESVSAQLVEAGLL